MFFDVTLDAFPKWIVHILQKNLFQKSLFFQRIVGIMVLKKIRIQFFELAFLVLKASAMKYIDKNLIFLRKKPNHIVVELLEHIRFFHSIPTLFKAIYFSNSASGIRFNRFPRRV